MPRSRCVPMAEPSEQPDRLKFPTRLRVRRRREFERTFADGLRLTDARITLWAIRNGLAYPRLGLIVGRKHGNAVRRNRIKRLLREAFRLSRPRLPAGLDLLCAPRRGADINLDGCAESLLRLSARLERQFRRRECRRHRAPRRRPFEQPGCRLVP